jgi:hypothetical protein
MLPWFTSLNHPTCVPSSHTCPLATGWSQNKGAAWLIPEVFTHN